MLRQFFIKKMVKATSVADAIKKEPKALLTDVWSEEIKQEEPQFNTHAIGFDAQSPVDTEVYEDNIQKYATQERKK